MKILVLGGTGAMGKPLIELLNARGDDVYVTSRSKRESKENIYFIQGDAHDWQFIQQQLHTHYDAIVDFMIYNTRSFAKRVNFYLDATDQYLFLSSSRVYADSKEPIKESSPRLLDICNDSKYLNTDEYALSKARSEDVLLNSGRKNWTIIRPYITYNAKRLQLGGSELATWLNAALSGRPIVIPQDVGQCETTMTYGNDVARAISFLIGNKNALEEVFNVTGNDHMAWNDVASIYQSIIEEKTGLRPKLYIPENSIQLSGILGNNFQIKYDRTYNRIFDNSKLLHVCGEELSFISMRDGLKTCLRHYLELSEEEKVTNRNVKYEAWIDKLVYKKVSIKGIRNNKDKLKYLSYYYVPQIVNGVVKIRQGIQNKSVK